MHPQMLLATADALMLDRLVEGERRRLARRAAWRSGAGRRRRRVTAPARAPVAAAQPSQPAVATARPSPQPAGCGTC